MPNYFSKISELVAGLLLNVTAAEKQKDCLREGRGIAGTFSYRMAILCLQKNTREIGREIDVSLFFLRCMVYLGTTDDKVYLLHIALRMCLSSLV